MAMSTAPHCWAGRTLPMLAAASSGVGERPREVKGLETKMVARFGTLGQARKASTREQSAHACQRPWTNVVTA